MALVSQWLLNDNLPTTDIIDSQAVNAGILNGGDNTDDLSADGPDGVSNTSLLFVAASSQSINFGDILPLGTGDFSFTGWFNTRKTSGNPIITKMFDSVEWWRIQVQGNVIAADFDDLTPIGKISIEGTTIVTDGIWHFFAITREAGVGMKLYVDGQAAEKSADDPGNLTTGNSSDVFIGFAEQPGNYFDGNLADIRAYNSTLTASQIEIIRQEMIGETDPALKNNFQDGLFNLGAGRVSASLHPDDRDDNALISDIGF